MNRWLFSAILLSVVLFGVEVGRSLPAFQTLLESKTGHKAGCAACHVQTSRRLTLYGREFVRLGWDAAALDALDVMDSDGDGISSGSELREQSNPGDPRSTPRQPGPWTARQEEPTLPEPVLNDVFDSKVFGWKVGAQAVQVRLTPNQAREAELSLKEKLADAEKVPTVFLIRDYAASSVKTKTAQVGGEVLARAGYAFFANQRLNVFLVFLGPQGRLIGVRPLSLGSDQRLAHRTYYNQFAGKTYEGLRQIEAPLGAEADNEVLIAAVRRCMKILELAVPTKKE